MQYGNVIAGSFCRRPNRFIAQVEIEGKEETVHVKNTGRCRELLLPGARVYLEERMESGRKTRYDLIAVEKQGRLINMDSQAPNRAAGEWLVQGNLFPMGSTIRPECRYRTSRFDFYLESGERRAFVEVKGVTLEKDGAVYFPDAPTERGVKHVRELCECLRDGYEAFLLFVVQMEHVRFFSPNDATDPAFGEALRRAEKEGVRLLAAECCVTPDTMILQREIPIFL